MLRCRSETDVRIVDSQSPTFFTTIFILTTDSICSIVHCTAILITGWCKCNNKRYIMMSRYILHAANSSPVNDLCQSLGEFVLTIIAWETTAYIKRFKKPSPAPFWNFHKKNIIFENYNNRSIGKSSVTADLWSRTVVPTFP